MYKYFELAAEGVNNTDPPKAGIRRSKRMEVCCQNANFTLGGEGSALPGPMSISFTYSGNALVNSLLFQSLLGGIKPKESECHCREAYFSLERR